MPIPRLPAAIAAVAIGLIGYGLFRYPLPAWPLALALASYGVWLWRQKAAWLVVIPAVLPAYDLAPWSGWLVVGEPDFFILATIAVMAVRHPPARADFWPGLRAARFALPFLACLAIGTQIGVLTPGPVGGSDNPYLGGWETVRLAWPCLAAIVLLGFARAHHRVHGDTMVWFGFGMVAGLAAVSLLAVAERLVFPGLLHLAQDYRVVGPFSSMHVGGGHIGAYIAFSLPFLNVCLVHRRAWSMAVLPVVALLAAYALLVTFARTAYAAGMVGAMVAAFAPPVVIWLRRRKRGTLRMLASIVPLLIGLAAITVGLEDGPMGQRLRTVVPDLGARAANWTGGINLGDATLATRMFGMGLGSYPRVAALRLPANEGPSNYVLQDGGTGRSLVLRMKLPLYFGQKIQLAPGETYRLRMRARALRPGRLGIVLCEKMLLYSQNCRGVGQSVAPDWIDIDQALVAPGSREEVWSLARLRPLDLSFGLQSGQEVEIAQISLTDPAGGEHIANGNFANGMARWIFTDDHHWSWRIFNQYLMTLFELGLIGALAALLLGIAGFMGAVRAISHGDAMAACLAPALAAIAVSFLFDAILEAPRLALLFYLMVGFGLDYLTAPRAVRVSLPRSPAP